MENCCYYKEEKPFFQSIGSDGIEIHMIPVCTKSGIEKSGMPSDIINCGGILENCPFKEGNSKR